VQASICSGMALQWPLGGCFFALFDSNPFAFFPVSVQHGVC
jgi:hypothetical protein